MHLICSKVAVGPPLTSLLPLPLSHLASAPATGKAPAVSAPLASAAPRPPAKKGYGVRGEQGWRSGRAAFKMIKVASCRDNETPTKRRKFQLNVKAKQILTLLRESWTKNVSPARLCVARLQKGVGIKEGKY